MAQLEELDLGFNRLKTEDIRQIAGLKNLRTLRLTNSPQVKDDAMQVVAGFAKLERLELAISGVGDKGIAYLAPLKNLKELNLYGQQVTDGAMKVIGKMEKMEVLNLGSTKITDAGLAELKGPSGGWTSTSAAPWPWSPRARRGGPSTSAASPTGPARATGGTATGRRCCWPGGWSRRARAW
jgi:hypothetical protein